MEQTNVSYRKVAVDQFYFATMHHQSEYPKKKSEFFGDSTNV